MEKLNITQWAKEDRPREKMVDLGTEALSNAELLAILIGSGSTDESAVALMKRVLADCNNNLNTLGKKTMHELMMRSPYENRILIILSDVKPNDVCRIPGTEDGQPRDYNGDLGVADTAAEVRKARADGISVICVFTGADEDIHSARLIYGKDFARIQSVDMLAQTVGKLVLSCIRNL